MIRSNWLKIDPLLADSLDQPQDAMYLLDENGATRIPYLTLSDI